MRKPYINQQQRFLIYHNTLSGAWVLLHFRWVKLWSELFKPLKP